MAFGQQRATGDYPEENHEINVTPFIDVILVLLIIFMVAAPLATVNIPVDLPEANATPTPNNDEPITLSMEADLSLSLGDNPVSRDTLATQLNQVSGQDREQRIFLRTDQSVEYGEVIKVMNLLRNAGYLKVALVGLETAPDGN